MCCFVHRGAEDDNAAVAMNITKIVHWSRAGVNSSVSHGQMPSDKLQWRRRSFQQLLFGNWKLFHPVPLISLAVWARCCVACLVELKAALQQGSRLLKLANLPKHFLSRSGAQCVWVASEGSGHGKPKTLTGLHVVFRGKSVVRGFRYAWSVGKTDGSSFCSGLFSCLSWDLRNWLQEIRTRFSLCICRSRVPECDFFQKHGSLFCRLLFLFWG